MLNKKGVGGRLVRSAVRLGSIFGCLALVYVLWPSGKTVVDGRHDLGANAMWLQHGWLGDDGWFERNNRDRTLFRDPERIRALNEHCTAQHIRTVYPHLCPCASDGSIAPVDPTQVDLFLAGCAGLEVLPWVGGVNGGQVFLATVAWREQFVASVVELLAAHPKLAGIQVNIEPLPSGDADFLLLLEELRAGMPEGKILSVAGYPPPTRWHPFPEVHWEESYIRAVSERVDEIAFMMYDAGQKIPKSYEALMRKWTRECLAWTGECRVLLGVPTYTDHGVGYHYAHVENLHHALRGIHAGLASFEELPKNYRGLAIYCEWETDAEEWALWRRAFLTGE